MTNKDKIARSMREFLGNNYDDRKVIESLPALWKKLEGEGLLDDAIKQGFTYNMFVQSCLTAMARRDFFSSRGQA